MAELSTLEQMLAESLLARGERTRRAEIELVAPRARPLEVDLHGGEEE